MVELLRKCAEKNVYTALNQAEYEKHYNTLVEHYETVRNRLVEINDKYLECNTKLERIFDFIKMLEKSDTLVTEIIV